MAPAEVYDRVGALRAWADGKIDIVVWNKLYRRELWKGIRFPVGHVYEDWDTTYRIIDLCRTVYVVNQSLYLHRQRLGSITDTTSGKNISDFFVAHSHTTSFIEAHTPEIFTVKQLGKERQAYLSVMLFLYLRRFGKTNADGEVLDENLRKVIIAKGKETGVETCNLRIRTAYWMLLHCPWLLKIVYPVYHAVWQFLRRFTGR